MLVAVLGIFNVDLAFAKSDKRCFHEAVPFFSVIGDPSLSVSMKFR